MAFSFGRGNLGQLVRAPLHLFGRLVTAVVPRRPGSWVVGCGSGVGEGALVLARHVRAARPDLGVTWLTGNDREAADAEAAGFGHRDKSSPAGWWLTARAEVVVITHGFGDVCRFTTAGAYVVQLWHGIPLKRIQLDSPVTMRLPGPWTPMPVRRLLAAGYRRRTAQISLLPAASDRVATRMRTAFSVRPAVVRVTGDPRDDVLADRPGRDADAAAALRAALPELPAGPAVLYAPTWRDGAADPAIPTAREWEAIIAALDRVGATLVIRSHPHGTGSYADGPARSRRIAQLGHAAVADITPVLPAFDQLVTDYSSIALDFALLDRPVHFLAPDADAYAATRELYDDYRSVAGAYATSWAQTTSAIEAVLTDAEARADAEAASRRLAEAYHLHRDGRASERVLAAILADLDARRGGTPAARTSAGGREPGA